MGVTKSKLSHKLGTPFSKIKNQIQPLDLITFRGGELVSDMIAFMEKVQLGDGSWTHVGLVITSDIVPIKNGIPGKLYVWESTMSGSLGDGVNNIELGKGTFGVQIRDLEDVIDKYDNDAKTKIGWAKLVNNPLIKKDTDTDDEYNNRVNMIKKVLIQFHKDTNNTTYDYNCCNLFSALFQCCSSCKGCLSNQSDKYFCSELVADIYKKIDIIKSTIDPETITPMELLGAGATEIIDNILDKSIKERNMSSPFMLSPVKIPPVVITREWI